MYGYLVFLKLDSLRLFSAAVVGWLAFLSSLVAEKIGFFLEHLFQNPRFALPLDQICRLVTANLLGAEHPLARLDRLPSAPVVT